MTTTTEQTDLHEQITLTEATRGQQRGKLGRRLRIKLISAGWGSKGYYGPAVLQEAARSRVFAAGTQMYLDHPTQTEQFDRPERSVRDLAAVLATDASYQNGALFAEATVFGPYQQFLSEMRDHIGISIRARGEGEYGEADGRSGLIITAINEARSVDFVTAAGRGGEILDLLESAPADLTEARNVGQWLEARIHAAFSCLADDMYGEGRLSREERIVLSSAIGDGLTAFTSRIEADQPQLYSRDLWDEPGPQTADVTEATTKPGGVPPSNPTRNGRSGVTGTTSGPAPDGGAQNNEPPANTELAEAQRRAQEVERQLAEARAQVERLSDNAVRADRAEQQLQEARVETARLRAADAARQQTMTALTESGLPEAAWPRVTNVVLGSEGRAVPLTESYSVDAERLTQAITAAVDSERTYIAQLAEAAGTGVPRGLGGGVDKQLSESQFQERFAALLQESGSDENTAKIAAKGR